MNRRESLKTLLIGSLGGTLLIQGCAPGAEEVTEVTLENSEGYGRTAKEKQIDLTLNSQIFFSEHEADTIATLCDLILPATTTAVSATDAEVPGFIEFIVKDMPRHQLPLRGGIMWLDNLAKKSYQKEFIACSADNQKALLDQIAYPQNVKPGLEQGAHFFSLIRDLTLTGYYTSKPGIEDLGYKGNTPNVWDGVPDDVLKEHGLAYEPEWLAKCVDQSKRSEIATWDEQGNLLT